PTKNIPLECFSTLLRFEEYKRISPSADGEQRLCLWKLRAFKKARAKLLSFLGKCVNLPWIYYIISSKL
ncbi:MAG: hypothetical protein SOT80_09860, partial [Candidatus Pseudoruminococcus sp.]|nr:hypothetical protein [Candidatus Pseudoruminococcus sp.]